MVRAASPDTLRLASLGFWPPYFVDAASRTDAELRADSALLGCYEICLTGLPAQSDCAQGVEDVAAFLKLEGCLAPDDFGPGALRSRDGQCQLIIKNNSAAACQDAQRALSRKFDARMRMPNPPISGYKIILRNPVACEIRQILASAKVPLPADFESQCPETLQLERTIVTYASRQDCLAAHSALRERFDASFWKRPGSEQ